MSQHWTFGQKIGAGFAATALLVALLAGVAVYALQRAIAEKDDVINVTAQKLLEARKLESAAERKVTAVRAYLLLGQERFVDEHREARDHLASSLQRLRALRHRPEGLRLVEAIEMAERTHEEAVLRLFALRRKGSFAEELARAFDTQVLPRRAALDRQLASYVSMQEARVSESRDRASAAAASAVRLVIGLGLGALLLAFLLTWTLSRSLSRQIGGAVSQVQSSSVELEAAASQQALGVKEQAGATAEIATTVTELLAAARQIAESAQRVAQIASDTSKAALAGGRTVEHSSESLGAIRRQVELVVSHMLELGKRSQQIGAVLEIVSELAEQTDILAINATIEAAGAGEAGRRFAVVADEIRKLADRVGRSAKEVRGLIEDVRSAVNVTVIATEGGAKAVEAGARQFAEVSSAFGQINDLVATTTDAAKEIELSTRQQTVAVEQLSSAITSVAQATEETRVSADQTLQTVGHLTALARGLQRIIRPDAFDSSSER